MLDFKSVYVDLKELEAAGPINRRVHGERRGYRFRDLEV